MYHNFANLFLKLSESTFFKEISKFQLKSEFQHKGNKQTKKLNSHQNLAFSWQEQIQKIKLFKYYTKRTKNIYIWTKLSSLGQELTFKPAKYDQKG